MSMEAETEAENGPATVTTMPSPNEVKAVDGPANAERVMEITSRVPEKYVLRWIVQNFSAFRNAAKTSTLPPLRSPEIEGLGVSLLLHPFGPGGHLYGELEFPDHLHYRDATYCATLDLLHPESDQILTARRLTIEFSRNKSARSKTTFKISKRNCLGRLQYKRFLVFDRLCLRCALEVYPHGASTFNGWCIGRQAHSDEALSRTSMAELLSEMRTFCLENPSQNVTLQCARLQFQGSRFLLCCRSQRWRVALMNESTKNWGVLTVDDIDPTLLQQLLDYIHTNTCSFLENNSDDDSLVMLMLAAEKYGIASLRKRVCEDLCSRVKGTNVFKLWEVAKQCPNADALLKACANLMDSLPGSDVAEMMRLYVHSEERPGLIVRAVESSYAEPNSSLPGQWSPLNTTERHSV